MKVAIIAAGEGSRLSNEGACAPKPLIKINGEYMIDRLIRIFTENGAEEVVVIVNCLTNLVKENGIENNVEFLGYTLRLNKYYNIADCLVACSFREGLPLNVIEAMLCGDAVVASNNRGHRELVEDGVNGFIVDATDIDGFAYKIIKVLDNPSFYAKPSLEKAELFTDRNVVEELKKIYYL